MSTINETIKSPDSVDDVDYSWEVKANDRTFHETKKTGFLCFQKNKYANNRIKTSKYNLLTFIPQNLYEQFQKAHVVYFTFMVILQCIPQIATHSWIVVMPVLMCILLVRALRDLMDDIAHRRSDKLINNKPCRILTGQRLQMKKWKHILVGDIVCLQKDEFVPADMLLLNSTEPNSLCYVETAGIDGETNLKFRQSLTVTHSTLNTEHALAEFDGLVTCEAPNVRLHKFVGTLDWKGKTYPLNNENILLRGCRIRNTQHCYGLVIYAGFDTKIMKNSGKARLKKTMLDSVINKMVVSIAVMLIFVSLFLAVGAGVWDALYLQKHYYIPGYPQISASVFGFGIFWSYITTLHTLVPFSLYIMLDVIHAIHNSFINNDLEIYHAETDTPAQAKSTGLSDPEYVFTDKTGTLTQNVMTFKKCCIGHKMFGIHSGTEEDHQKVKFDWNTYADSRFQFYDQSLVNEVCKNEDPLIREFFRMIALCHTVMVDEKPGNLVYQAASPDEEALVTAARNFGYVFLSRTQETITISELGVQKTYSILALLDFSSVRKRMSILVREPEGKIKLYTKGADSVILERIHSNCKPDFLMAALDGFGEETLRTLCLAYKEVKESYYEQWKLRHQEASISLQSREEHLEDVYEEIETGLQLLGATAIEDKLQDGVPETIKLLRDGNIKVWMLTGDKQETAVNIAYSCNLLSSDMQLMDENDIRCFMDNRVKHYTDEKGQHSPKRDSGTAFSDTEGSCDKRALIITGDFLSKFIESYRQPEPKMSLWKKQFFVLKRKNNPDQNTNQNGQALVELACRCQSVICCRVTPKQKASIVELVKSNKKVITLAIGDGGNDVNMIRTADIGIGINGKEGVQAVLASDFAIAQFSFLQRLLFVHGRWSYMRFIKFLCFYNYKTFASLMHNIWFAFFNCFTALPVYDSLTPMFTSLVYTFYPTLCMGILDKDMESRASLQHPELYINGQKESLVGMKIFLHILYGTYTSLVMFFIPYASLLDTDGPEGIFDYQVFVFTMVTTGILAVLVEAIMEISTWSVFAFLAIGLSLIFYFLISYVTETPSAYFTDTTNFNFLDVFVVTLRSGYIWLIILLGVIVSVMPSLLVRSYYRLTNPSLVKCLAPKRNCVGMNSRFQRNLSKRRSSYAFSQSDGYGKIITRGASLRKVQAQVNGKVLKEE
ncbi:LOW QUALITY PROTEIN: phospholipid-transporting ATPase IK-like [Discoglossus pictus]